MIPLSSPRQAVSAVVASALIAGVYTAAPAESQVAHCSVPVAGDALDVDVPLPHDVSTGVGVGIALVDSGATGDAVVSGGDEQDLDHCILHGTAVAGVLHAIAPGSVIVSYRQDTTGGAGTVSGLVKALSRVVDQQTTRATSTRPPIRILNVSIVACEDTAELLHAVTALQDAGLLIIAAAGNSGQCPVDATPFPAALPNVLTVGAVDPRVVVPADLTDLGAGRQAADYSLPGPWVDLYAPGGPVSAELAAKDTEKAETIVGDPAPFVGTSFAAPVVAATAALVWQLRPELTADEVKYLITGTAIPGSVPVIDPVRAVTAALDASPVDTSLPRPSPWPAAIDPPSAPLEALDLRVPIGLAIVISTAVTSGIIRRNIRYSTSTVRLARSADSKPPSGSRSITAQGTSTGSSPSPKMPRAAKS